MDFRRDPCWAARMLTFLTRPRRRAVLIAVAAALGAITVAASLAPAFLAGSGPFWANPRGPWLMDSADLQDNIDALQMLTGYNGFLKGPWHLPVFFVASLGAPGGTNIIFMDAVPVAALAGKIVSGLVGQTVVPYGAWVGLCFVLSAVFSVLVVAEAGQRSLLAAVAASLLALSAPPLLHRFGHFALMAHFEILGALFLYLRDRRPTPPRSRIAAWGGWLALVALTHVYLLAMCGALYAASLLARRRRAGPRGWLVEPACVAGVLLAVAVVAGHLGPGTGSSPFAAGFGSDSMNLASPFWPQRSGLFPGGQAILDATGDQYEGFNYLGFGALLVVFGAAVLNAAEFPAMLRRHRELGVVLALLTLFALSNRVFLGDIKLIDLDYSWRLDHLAGIFRASGRMFWPAYYAIMLGGLVLLLRRLPPAWRVGIVVACCVLQLIDTEPLRHRLGVLSARDTPTVLDEQLWSRRIAGATRVAVYPTFVCIKAGEQVVPNIELQLFAARVGRPENSVDNSRLGTDCAAEAERLRSGPWPADTLYVLMSSGAERYAGGWLPPGLACHAFAQGYWCLGRAGG